MKRFQRTRLRVKSKTPGGRQTWHFKDRRPSHPVCSSCKNKLNRGRYTSRELKRLSKVEKRPERPYPNLCPTCMREQFKLMVRK